MVVKYYLLSFLVSFHPSVGLLDVFVLINIKYYDNQ